MSEAEEYLTNNLVENAHYAAREYARLKSQEDNAELLRATQKLSNDKIVPSDEVLIEFLDWFGTWQTDKNLDDYGINDVLDSFKTSLIAKHSK